MKYHIDLQNFHKLNARDLGSVVLTVQLGATKEYIK